MTKDELLYVGVKGSVAAYEKATGRQVWAVHLDGSDFVNLLLDGDRIFAHTKGELYALNAITGEGLWHDPLKGLGYELATLVSSASPSVSPSVFQQHAADVAAAHSSSSSGSPSS